MSRRRYISTNMIIFVSLIVIFSLAFVRIHMRIQSTIIGYELGQLKDRENQALEYRSYLKMELAKLTTKEKLMEIANDENTKNL